MCCICLCDLIFFRDVSKFAMHFIVEEIDEDTSMEELQKMMLVALVYRILVCFYEVSRWAMEMFNGPQTVWWPIILLPDCVHLGGWRSHSREVFCWTPSCNLRLVCSGSARPGACGAGNKCVPVSVSCWFLNRSCVYFFLPLRFNSNNLSLFSQISRSSLKQELFNCFLFSSFHHASLLPAQQDCVWYGCWNYCGKALQSQMMQKSHVIVEKMSFFLVKKKGWRCLIMQDR